MPLDFSTSILNVILNSKTQLFKILTISSTLVDFQNHNPKCNKLSCNQGLRKRKTPEIWVRMTQNLWRLMEFTLIILTKLSIYKELIFYICEKHRWSRLFQLLIVIHGILVIVDVLSYNYNQKLTSARISVIFNMDVLLRRGERGREMLSWIHYYLGIANFTS